jgi:hypothetical protein
VRDLIRELLEFVDDVVDDLGSREEIRTSTQFSSAALQPTSSFKSGGRRATSMLSWTI